MNWTDEKVELLKKLWGEGYSGEQIAKKIGGVSRNAVVGKVHRLKLSARARATAAPARQKKPEKGWNVGSQKPKILPAPAVTPAPTPPPPMVVEEYVRPIIVDMVVPISRRLKLTDLNERTCKWPNGDPLSEDFGFCGNDAPDKGPYCKYHARLAFPPKSERWLVR